MTNPFGAPLCHKETVSSTMDVARLLAGQGEPHGTVIYADFQETGKGRSSRVWTSAIGENLLFTVLLRYNSFAALPVALTLRAGLAIAIAIEDFFPALAGKVKVKWPNDIMLCTPNSAKKTAGILAESRQEAADGSTVFLGAGINLLQKNLPGELQNKAASIALALEELASDGSGPDPIPPNAREALLEKILFCLCYELEGQGTASWKTRLEERLFKCGEEAYFAEGAADSPNVILGRVGGIGDEGGLLLTPHDENAPRLFFNGELRVY